MNHSHAFPSWPFDPVAETAVFTTRLIIEGREPIREVHHDADGDWQFLCGTTLDTADLKLVSLGSMLERDASIGALAKMPPGWYATRPGAGGEWIQQAHAAGERAG